MMYNQKLVASLKANGKVLREFKDTIYIPFGSEYSVLLKNLNTVRCVVNVFIDGDNVVPGGLVLAAGQECNLERSIKNGNLQEGNKFKFIERTGSIEEHRGIKLEDGLIRIEYQFEKYAPQTFGINQKWVPGHYEYDKTMLFGNQQPINTMWGPLLGSTGLSGASGSLDTGYNIGGALRGVDFSKNGATVQAQAASAVNQYCADNNIQSNASFDDGQATMDWMETEMKREVTNDVGITVPGSKSEQKFSTATIGVLETEKHTIVLKILGETADNKPVIAPVTVKAKPKCTSCGKVNKANAKFCSSCGTALELF